MKKLLSLMLAAAICLSLCPFAFAEDTVEIEMWSNMYGDELTALIEEYQAAHPNVKVNLLLISFWDFDSKLIPALAAGTAPDLFIGSLEFSHAADELALRADITDLVNAKGYDASRYMTFAAEACQEEGRVYGLPFATDTRPCRSTLPHRSCITTRICLPPPVWTLKRPRPLGRTCWNTPRS